MGWRTLQAAADGVPDPATAPTLEVLDVDRAFSELAVLQGPGSTLERRRLVGELVGRATAPERDLLFGLIGGELRQGALAGVMVDAVAVAAEVPATAVRRASMLGGRLDEVAVAALMGGREALAAVHLEVGRPLQPMLASTAASVGEAVAELGDASVEWKLDGIRVQAHKAGDDVRVWSRNLNDITDQVPGVVAAVAALPAGRAVLDGEALVIGADGRPAAFQDTASGRAVEAPDPTGPAIRGLRPFFFDLLHLDGRDLVDEPLAVRRLELERVAGEHAVPAVATTDGAAAEAALADALAAGHEGVVVKSSLSPYEAGRRGKAWRKVKPVHTLDLVVLAVEWGHGRRAGLLSNLHLGARRAEDGEGGDGGEGSPFVMVGKTFKGMTDELLRWQTEHFTALAVDDDVARQASDDPDLGPGVLAVQPVQVVEIAVDGIQRSTRYAGGIALRFARVVRYRDDKDADQADTVAAVRALGGS
ncbi:ATP-dependent DNA ligase [Dermatobacter hominis]|nr:ATP-dependent DNA ligase [Dermatobacter hominis]UDY34318.1 ATP-dependent DNA ligase [Dermatobacter hominis]